MATMVLYRVILDGDISVGCMRTFDDLEPAGAFARELMLCDEVISGEAVVQILLSAEKRGIVMARYRNVQMSFWTDAKVNEDFTPYEKLVYLYLLTNQNTSLCGCYGISVKQISNDTGIDKTDVETVMESLEQNHNVIRYSKEEREVLILNWLRYNDHGSDKTKVAISKGLGEVKTAEYRAYIQSILDGDTPSIPHRYPIDTPSIPHQKKTIPHASNGNANANVNVNVNAEEGYCREVEQVVSHLNEVCKTNYRPKSESTAKHIRARLRDGFTVDDCKRVIDVKFREWGGDERMSAYLRPQTLFSGNFESYLNQKEGNLNGNGATKGWGESYDPYREYRNLGNGTEGGTIFD